MTKDLIPFILILCLSLGCKQNTKDLESSEPSVKKTSSLQQTIYFGGDIITMDGSSLELAEAVVAQNDEIVFVGAKADALKQFPEAEQHDLKGNVLMPGLVEPHVHPSLAATMLPNEIIAPYDWVLPNGTKKGVDLF